MASSTASSSASVDYSRLKDPDLDAVDWINAMFQTGSASGGSTAATGAEQEALATSVVMKLQLYIQEVEKHVQDVMQSVSASVPRVVRDVESLRHETTMLHNEMSHVSNEVGVLCTDTKESMRTLVQLDLEHDRISQVLKFIQQADSWSTLTQQIEDCFLVDDIAGVCEKIVALKACVDAAKPTTGQMSHEFESRKSTLDALKNRTETMLSPKVIEAIDANDVDTFVHYKKIFELIDRTEAVFKFYYHHEKTLFQKTWSEIHAEGFNDKVSDLLTLLFGDLQTEVEKQQEFINKVADSSKPHKATNKCSMGSVICELVTQCILALEPSLTAVVKQSLANLHPKDVLVSLKDVHSVEKTFVENIELMASQKSVRLEAAVYASLVPILINYSRYLSEQLLPSLSTFSSYSAKDFHQVSNLIEDSRQVVERAVNDSLKLCQKVSGDLAILTVVEVLESQFFVSYLNSISDVIRKVSKRLGLTIETQKIDAASLTDSTIKSSVVAEDWTMFQNSAKLTQTVGRICNNLASLESSIVDKHLLGESLTILHNKSSGNENDSDVVFNYLKMWNSQAWAKLQEFVKLAQSSKDLVSLFPKSKKGVQSLIGKCQRLAINCVLEYPKQQFTTMFKLNEWCKMSDQRLSKFSLSPLEYITRVGQYMMSLPAQLEVLESDAEIQKVFSTNYITDGTLGAFKLGQDETLCELWLSAIVEDMLRLYLEGIMSLEMLTDEGARQMSTDVNYLQNVLDDLGLKLSDDLSSYLKLLDSPVSELAKLQNSVPQRLFNCVKSQRK